MTTFLLVLTVIFTDSSKTTPLFVPSDAFSSPRRYGLTKAMVEQLDTDMTNAKAAREMVDEGMSECATAEPAPPGDIEDTATILELTTGWNTEQHYVTTLARVKRSNGDETLLELPFGSMQIGRSTWCTGTDRLKAGDTIAFTAFQGVSQPERLIGTLVKR